jgi:hypothetical protein
MTPKRCAGWAVDSNRCLIRCSKLTRPSSPYKAYHSLGCYMFRLRRRALGYGLGDLYVRWSRTKRHPKLCEGWTIRDGVIATCAKPFTAGTTRQKHHTVECMYQTKRWRKIGYLLGDPVRRICGYRNCKKGEGGTRGTFDRIRRRKGGVDFWCDGRCAAAERRVREADSIATQLEEFELLKRRMKSKTGPGRGRKKDKETDTRIELMAERSAQGKSLRAMSTEVFPEKKHDPDAAYVDIRKLASKYRQQFEEAKRRFLTPQQV